MSLNDLSKQIHQQNKDKGFYDNITQENVNIGERLMLIVSELSEALEAHRGRGNQLNINEFKDYPDFKKGFELYIKDSFEDEIADSFIRLFDLCGLMNIDIEFHIEQKLKYNKTRESKHGKKY
jgi:NTP pyrophosphatase (non-canonical NTP hydrolase)